MSFILSSAKTAREIDIGAKQEIYADINASAKQGSAIVMVLSELPEVIGLSDRMLVLREGKITGEFTRQDVTPEKVMAAPTGNFLQARNENLSAKVKTDPGIIK